MRDVRDGSGTEDSQQTVEWLTRPRLPGEAVLVVRVRHSYDITAVDAFLADIAHRTPEEVAAVQFPIRRLTRGYDIASVDGLLDAWQTRLARGR